MRIILPLTILVTNIVIVGCGRDSTPSRREARRAVARGNSLLEQETENRKRREATNNDYNKMTQVGRHLYQRALAEYGKAIQLDPDYAEAYYRRGLARLKHGEPQFAVDDFSTTLSLDPDNAHAYLFRGRAYHELGDALHAEEDRTKALDLKPGID